MASGLFALLDDVAAIAKLAASTLDDVAAATTKAGAKSAGVVIDDTAVTPTYVQGFTPERELPVIWKIARGSLVNKLVVLLPLFVALAAFAPFALTPLLMLGGSYLCFEAAEKWAERLGLHHAAQAVHAAETSATATTAREAAVVKGAIRTDLILSAEILAIALGELDNLPIGTMAAALAGVGLAVTALVYGTVALIVKMDDIGLLLARRGGRLASAVGRRLVTWMPKLLALLSVVGIAAMAWVGGGILLHGLEETGILPMLPQLLHHLAAMAGAAAPMLGGAVQWLAHAALAGMFGMLLGFALVALLHFAKGWRRPPTAIG